MAFIENKTVITRKAHECWGCGREFASGSHLRVTKEAVDTKVRSTYWCKVCETYAGRYLEPDDEVGFGELRSEAMESWLSVKKEVEGK